MRAFWLLALFPCLAFSQGRPRVPANLGVNSVTARQAFFRSLYVDGGTVYDGEIAAQSFANSAGGEVYLPEGLAVDPGSFICLDSPTCNYTIYRSAGNRLVINGAGLPSIFIDGAQAQGPITAGLLSANACTIEGGATYARVSASSGTGATPDAGLRLRGGLPNGPVEVENAAGLFTSRVGAVDGGYLEMTGQGVRLTQTSAMGVCDQTTAGRLITVPIELFPDAGVRTEMFYCDGESKRWLFVLDFFKFSTNRDLPNGRPFEFVNPEAADGKILFGTYWVYQAGAPSGSYYTIDVLQGSTKLCSLGPIECNAVDDTNPVWDGRGITGAVGNGPCQPNKFLSRPIDGGTNYLVRTVFDGGCSVSPRGDGNLAVGVIGYPALP